jgi:hypothetical protein
MPLGACQQDKSLVPMAGSEAATMAMANLELHRSHNI